MPERKVCTYCGQEGHRAHECPRRVKIPDVEIRAMRWAAERENKRPAVVAREFNVTLRQAIAIVEGRCRNHLDARPLPPGYVITRSPT